MHQYLLARSPSWVYEAVMGEKARTGQKGQRLVNVEVPTYIVFNYPTKDSLHIHNELWSPRRAQRWPRVDPEIELTNHHKQTDGVFGSASFWSCYPGADQWWGCGGHERGGIGRGKTQRGSDIDERGWLKGSRLNWDSFQSGWQNMVTVGTLKKLWQPELVKSELQVINRLETHDLKLDIVLKQKVQLFFFL